MEVALKTYHKYQLYLSLCYILLKSCHLHSNSMHAIYTQNWYTGKHTWQVSVQVYIYISSMAYKTVLQTLETMKLGKNGGG